MARQKSLANFGILDKHIYFKNEVQQFLEELQSARELLDEKDNTIRTLEARISRMARSARNGVQKLASGDDEGARQLFTDIQTDANRRGNEFGGVPKIG